MIRFPALLCAVVSCAHAGMAPDLARVNDTKRWRFSEGTLEIDLRGGGKLERADDDPAARSHAVQYVAWPDYTWEKLRKDKPGLYEAAIQPIPDPAGWFHARIEVTKQKVSVFVESAKQPCLVVDRLAHQKGEVGLWVDSKPGAFRNLRIHPAP